MKNFDQDGIARDVLFGRRGGRLKHDFYTNDFFFRDAEDTFYLQVHGADPTEDTHFVTKAFFDSNVSGQPLTIREQDNDPNVSNVTEIRVSNGTLTDEGGGAVSITTGGGGTTASGFYGINVGQTDDSPTFRGINTLKFNTEDFYVTQNAPNTDEAIVNFRAANPPDNFSYKIVGKTIVIPVEQQMSVFGGIQILEEGELILQGSLILGI